MKIKVKKQHDRGLVKLEGSGEIKEVMIHSDMLDNEKGKISICFRGHNSSGIVELTEKEANDFHTRVREAYLERARYEPHRIKILDSSKSIDAIRIDIVLHLIDAGIIIKE